MVLDFTYTTNFIFKIASDSLILKVLFRPSILSELSSFRIYEVSFSILNLQIRHYSIYKYNIIITLWVLLVVLWMCFPICNKCFSSTLKFLYKVIVFSYFLFFCLLVLFLFRSSFVKNFRSLKKTFFYNVNV